MKKKYKHLTVKERVKLSVLHSKGLKPAQIAQILQRNRSTIYRELKRITSVFYRGCYVGEASHRNFKRSWIVQHRKERIKNPVIKKYIQEKLNLFWSPELIAGRLKLELDLKISAESIYRYIYDGNRHLTPYLTRQHCARKKIWMYKKTKRHLIPNRTDIDFRSDAANNRQEFGHFEADCIVSKKGSKSALLVLVDRKTRLTKIKRLERKTAAQACNAIVKALQTFNTNHLNTITYDNGSEFCYHEKINHKLGTKSYFCKPYHSWEKGSVENTNGLIRRFFPKKTDFDIICDEKIQGVENWLNTRPKKCLGFKTPMESFIEASCCS
jgi:IS30 family transposase